ncbi:TATA box-binding protein-associated factor RNA polymerase I subunit B-like isoform X2 [Ptychodera flava]|uniref:TATA box-binding protein-associated factor RNA polymerase I subunit B-like isoform X2 n=1 Tax=Ptychodera flava TaxID=63121 RepID=UPI00396AA03C
MNLPLIHHISNHRRLREYEASSLVQDVRDIQQEEDFVQSRQLSMLQIKKSALPGIDSKTVDRGKPWFTFEAFQHIIKEQVNCLLKIGVSPKLKEVVRQLWFGYLKTSGVAFTGKDEKAEVIFDSVFARTRDKHPGSVDDPDIRPPAGTLKRKRHSSASSAKSASSASESDLPDWVPTEDFYPGDNPFENSSSGGDTSSSDEDQDTDVGSVGSVDHKVKAKRKRLPIQVMTMDLTVCFLYLALLLLGEPVLLCDLMRWIHEGHVPYAAANKILPNHMKFSYMDSSTFCVGVVPSVVTIRHKAGRLAHYLRLPPLPAINVNKITSRFILELHLPDEFHGYLRNLASKGGSDLESTIITRQQRLLFYEGIAMAYIIVALKMLFTLDDSKEHVISAEARRLQKSLPQGVDLFIWDDWVKFMKARINFHRSRSCRKPSSHSDIRNRVDIKPYILNYNEVISKWKGLYTIKQQKKCRAKREVTIKERKKPFHALQEALGEKQTEMPKMSSFCHPRIECEDGERGDRDSVKEEVDQDEWKFSSCTLQYIINRDLFLQKFENELLPQSYDRSSDCNDLAESMSGDWTGEEEVSDYGNLTQDLNERLWDSDDRGRTSQLLAGLKRHRSYVTYPDYRVIHVKSGGKFSDENDEFHHSYKWLLDVCAEILETKVHDLHDQVIKVEKMLRITGTSRSKNDFMTDSDEG